mgnify:CR=1 FL=1
MARFFYQRVSKRRLIRRVWTLSRPIVHYTITAAQGSYTLSGQAVNLLQGYLVSAAQGSYSLAGQATTFQRTYIAVADQGSYSLSGQAAALGHGYGFAAAQGSYALTGQSASLLTARILTAAQGSYALTGQTVDLRKGRTLDAAQGSYSLTGQSAGFVYHHVIAAAAGSYSLTGNAADLTIPAVVVTPTVTGTTGGGGTSSEFYSGKRRYEVRRAIERALRELSETRTPRSRKRRVRQVAKEIVAQFRIEPFVFEAVQPIVPPELLKIEGLRLKIFDLTLRLQEKQAASAANAARLEKLFAEYQVEAMRLQQQEDEEAIMMILVVAA